MAGKGQGNNDPTSSRGREKGRKGKRRVENNTPSCPPFSEMPMSYPPPHGYTELPQHHEPYTFIQTPSLPSQGHRTIRPTYSPAASQPSASQPFTSHPHGSHPYISQPYGSHPSMSQPLGSQPSVSHPLGSHPAMSQSQGSQPSSSSTPSIAGLRLRGSSSDPPTPSSHASDTHASDGDDEVVHYDRYGRIIIVPEGDGFRPGNKTTKIITNAIRKLYDGPYATWTNCPFSLKE
ncbi:uncharacterized protein LOC142169872 [Nicotiana tabacum]|uniref:Uncharacterized protein LOC142169872 n=1 Tax=Nicotiana tabacum TaxID=4097 RepID=A0AC58SSH9_TOBAC